MGRTPLVSLECYHGAGQVTAYDRQDVTCLSAIKLASF